MYQRSEGEEIGWELYDMDEDRTELNNLAHKHEGKVNELKQMWHDWAKRCRVMPWPLHPIPDGEKDWSNLPWFW